MLKQLVHQRELRSRKVWTMQVSAISVLLRPHTHTWAQGKPEPLAVGHSYVSGLCTAVRDLIWAHKLC